MKLQSILLISVAVAASSSVASAQTVLNTDLQQVSGTYGSGNAVTTTNANGTSTTVTGPGGGSNRATATPNASWYQSDVGGGGTAGITKAYTNDGNGAAYFSTVNADSKADLRHNFTAPVALSSLTSMSFDFYRDVSSAANPLGTNFVPSMRLDIIKGANFAGSLILEYKYQDQSEAPTGVWTSLGATLNSGIFWATNAALGPTFAAANGGQKTLAEWIAANNDATLSVVGVSTGAGSGWNQFNGAVDHVAYDFTGGPTANFDFAVAGVPEPATWTLMIGGFGLIGATMRRRSPVRA